MAFILLFTCKLPWADLDDGDEGRACGQQPQRAEGGKGGGDAHSEGKVSVVMEGR